MLVYRIGSPVLSNSNAADAAGIVSYIKEDPMGQIASGSSTNFSAFLVQWKSAGGDEDQLKYDFKWAKFFMVGLKKVVLTDISPHRVKMGWRVVPENITKSCRKHSQNMQKTWQNHPENIPKTSRKHHKIIQKTCPKHTENITNSSRKHSQNIQKTSPNHSENITKSSRKHHQIIQKAVPKHPENMSESSRMYYTVVSYSYVSDSCVHYSCAYNCSGYSEAIAMYAALRPNTPG